jgi:hypothetical protein
MKNKAIGSVVWLLALTMAGCAGNPMRQYDDELKETVTLVRNGSVGQAVDQLEKNNTAGVISKDKDILYYFEKGELLNLGSNYAAGRDAWLKADEIVRQWEEELKTSPEKVLGDIGSYLVNDKTRRYDGQDYEKVLLSTRLTLNHIMLGNYDHARIEMKKTYEREKLIEAFREKEYDKLKEDAEKQHVSSDARQLKDYPMAELDTPEVRELKNGFQNAFSHYLAGYFFEVTGELSLAEPGYRNALQLAPNRQIIQAGLNNVGRRKPGAKESDVLFVVESGFAPAWKSITLPIPLPQQHGLVVTPLSFPIVKSVGKAFVPTTLTVAGRQLPVETLTNVDTMSRRLLKDQMPGIVVRTIIRAVGKSVVQKQAQKAGLVGGLVATIATVVTEQADERSWRTLPERVSIARATLPHGTQTVEFQTGAGTYRAEVEIGNRFTIIPIRLTGGAVYLGQANVMGSLSEAALADSEIRRDPVPDPGKKAVRKKSPPKVQSQPQTQTQTKQ